jgi:hypothetical protein
MVSGSGLSFYSRFLALIVVEILLIAFRKSPSTALRVTKAIKDCNG